MSKSRSFSIYLLKEGFDATNTLKDEHTLDDQIAGNSLPDGAILYVLDNAPIAPWWKNYFGIQKNLTQALKGAIVFLPVGTRTFAITFGHVFHNLKDTSYEYDFGLRVTLNSVDPEKLKSLDSLSPENARRQRTQLPVNSDLTYFDFDQDSTILKSLTGKVKDEYKAFFKHATGASSIRVSSDVSPDGLPELCEKLLNLYSEETFKTAFPDIQNVSPVKDPVVIDALNNKLITAFRTKDDSLILTIPEIVNYHDELYATFSGAGASLVYDDVFIDRYYEYLEGAEVDLNDVEVETLKKHNLVLTNEDGQSRGDRPNIFKCLIFDASLNNGTASYHLCEGNWYLVDSDYISSLTTYLDPLCADTELPVYNHADEGKYNEAAKDASQNRLCMDKKSIAPTGQKQVEPCDIMEHGNGSAILHHVKKSTVSATLSHLFNQGLNSIRLIRDSEEAHDKLKALAQTLASDDKKADFAALLAEGKYKVVYQIITHKDKIHKSQNLPLFSRISLRRAMKELRRMDIKAEYCFVENQTPKSEGKKKKRKKKEDTGQTEQAA